MADRVANRIQLTSDGHKAYLDAVEGAFGADVDYAMLVKLYGASPDSAKGRYSPAECIGARKERITGNPDKRHVSTSYRGPGRPRPGGRHCPSAAPRRRSPKPPSGP